MKKLLIFFAFINSIFSLKANAQLPPTDSSWELKFSDEFDSLIPYYIADTSLWARQFPFGQNGLPEICKCHIDFVTGDTICDTLNGKSYFTQWDDTTLSSPSLLVDTNGSGTLRIIAQKQNYFIHSALYNYTSAMLYSKHRFKYGYFELKFKIPGIPISPAVNKGFTTDWWMWDRQGLKSNEIDMFEIRNLTNTYTNNLHYKRDSAGTDLSVNNMYTLPNPLDSNWHISALEWEPDRIDYYLDGVKIRSNPFHPDSMIAMPMIIDLDVLATNFCDSVDSAYTVFPFEFDVDYVKVYQLKVACDTDRTICTYTTADSIFQSLTFGGGACTPTVPSSSNTTFRASDFIELDQGFYADSTSEMLLDVVPCQPGQEFSYHAMPPSPIPIPLEYIQRNWFDY